jgi:hypothetical protein
MAVCNKRIQVQRLLEIYLPKDIMMRQYKVLQEIPHLNSMHQLRVKRLQDMRLLCNAEKNLASNIKHLLLAMRLQDMKLLCNAEKNLTSNIKHLLDAKNLQRLLVAMMHQAEALEAADKF